MRWFGGFSGGCLAPRSPVGGRRVWTSIRDCWLIGKWDTDNVQIVQNDRGNVAVIGLCEIPGDDLARLAIGCIPDDVAWRWSGCYTVIQITDDGTTVWTDLGGAWPIYYVAADDGLYWSSSARALAALTNQRPDLDRLAAWLTAPYVPALLTRRSAFAGVELAEAGYRMSFPRSGRPRRQRMWWPASTNGDPAVRLRTELSAAVAVRVGSASAPTVDLSGGFDSTALALLAAEILAPDRKITGVTVHPEGITLGGDMMYAREAAQHPGIVHRLMPLGPMHAPYSALGSVPATDEPAPSTIAHARFAGQLQWMREEFGSDCHMTGDGGDSLLCSPPIILADMVSTRRYHRALIETIWWARVRRLPVWPLLVTAWCNARVNRTDALRKLADTLQVGKVGREWDGDIGWFPTVAAPPWSTPDARDRAAAVAYRVAGELTRLPRGELATFVTAEAMAEVGRSARSDVEMAEYYGINLQNPFMDSRVIHGYLSTPLIERPGPAEYKPILSRALSDLFPAALIRRITKGDFNPDHYAGMRLNIAELNKLADGHLADMGLVDPGVLRRELNLAASGLPVAFSAVEPAVAAEVWLRALNSASPVRWLDHKNSQGAA